MAEVETPADRHAILRRLITAAKRGESWAQTIYYDRKFGRMPNVTQVGGMPDGDGEPIKIVINRPQP